MILNNNTTTLYIGDTSIRLMVTRGKRVTKLADVPLDTSLSEIDSEEKQNELLEKIKLLFKTNKIRSKKIILGISGLHCLTRPLSLPELPKTMLDEAVRREAKRVLPVPPEQLYISWHTTAVSEGRIQAFLVGIPRYIADPLLEMLNKAGFKPYLMDIKPLALARLSREATAIIVDVQSTEFDIIISVNGIPQPIRTLAFPQECQSLEDRLVVVKDELKRTVQFYNSNNPDNTLQADDIMYVSGELNEEPELCRSLADEMGFIVTLLSSPLKCMKQLDPSRHLVNVGLALKDVTKEAGPLLANVNTLPEQYLPKPISVNRIIAIPTAAVAIGTIVLLGLTVQDTANNIEKAQTQLDANNIVIEKRQAQKKNLTDDIAAKESQLAGIEAIRAAYANALNFFSVKADLIDDDLQATVDNVVPDLELYSIDLSREQVSLGGKASTEEEILEYVRNLEETGRFEEVTIANITRETLSDNTTLMDYKLAVRLPESEE